MGVLLTSTALGLGLIVDSFAADGGASTSIEHNTKHFETAVRRITEAREISQRAAG